MAVNESQHSISNSSSLLRFPISSGMLVMERHDLIVNSCRLDRRPIEDGMAVNESQHSICKFSSLLRYPISSGMLVME